MTIYAILLCSMVTHQCQFLGAMPYSAPTTVYTSREECEQQLARMPTETYFPMRCVEQQIREWR